MWLGIAVSSIGVSVVEAGAAKIGTLVVGAIEIVIAGVGIVELDGIEEGSTENSVMIGLEDRLCWTNESGGE